MPCCGNAVIITFCSASLSGSVNAPVKSAAAKASVPPPFKFFVMSDTLGAVSTASDPTEMFPTTNCAVLGTLDGM